MKRCTGVRQSRGFSLIQLSLWMLGLGLALALFVRLLPSLVDETRLEATIATIDDTQGWVLGFLVSAGRLPVPDTDNDGIENIGATAGALPFRSMGLPAPVVDEANLPLRYSPYRNTTDSADLAGSENLYIPDLPDGTPNGCPANPASPVNLLDFCTALSNAAAAASVPTTSYVNTQVSGSGTTNVAYALLSGGLEDADGNNADSSLDGLNDDLNLTYEDPARGRGAAYDDIVRTTPFAKLDRELSCEALVSSVDMLASVAQGAADIATDAQDRLDAAEVQVILASVNVGLGVLTLADITIGIVGMGIDVPKAVAGCNVPPNVLCCPALVALGVALTAYGVTAAVEVAKLGVTIAELATAVANRDLLRDVVVPAADTHLCSALSEAVAADARGGL